MERKSVEEYAERGMEYLKIAVSLITVGKLMKEAKEFGNQKEYTEREAQFYSLVESGDKKINELMAD